MTKEQIAQVARAREQRMREELAEIGVALNDPADNLTATTAQCITRLRAREAKLREALTKTTANLRHAYANLFSTTMSADDTRRFADGLIAPEIRRLGATLAEGEGTRG